MYNQYGYAALTIAAHKGSAECVASLLAVDGIDVNVANTVRRKSQQHTRALAYCVVARFELS